jgi:hypothetical protein
MLIVPILAGCIGTDPLPPTNEGEDEPTAVAPSVVIADISPGVNPYHVAFARPHWTHHPSAAVHGFPANATALPLTLNATSYEAARSADDAVWDNFTAMTLYWVPGTNLLLFAHRPWNHLPDGGPSNYHGAMTAYAASVMCSECYVLVFLDFPSLDGKGVRYIAEEMPWVDTVTSTTVPGDPFTEALNAQYAKATRELYRSGRTHFVFAGNSPVAGTTVLPVLPGAPGVPIPYPHFSFPPWVVMVGGAHSECHATELMAGDPPDFVGNFTQPVALAETLDGMAWAAGTSFATPQLAGAFGAILLQARRALPATTGAPGTLWSGPAQTAPHLADGALTTDDILDAMARSARHFATADYEVGCPRAIYPVPASAMPWMEMGWGYIGPEETAAAAAGLLDGTLGDHDGATQTWMRNYRDVRGLPYGPLW